MGRHHGCADVQGQEGAQCDPGPVPEHRGWGELGARTGPWGRGSVQSDAGVCTALPGTPLDLKQPLAAESAGLKAAELWALWLYCRWD